MILDHSTESFVFLQAHLGGDRNFCYLLGDPKSGDAAVVDPGFDPRGVLDLAAGRGLSIRHILITHGHADHHGAAGAVATGSGAAVHAGAADRVPGAEPVSDGQRIAIGGLEIRAIATPGHSPGHV